MFNPETRPAFCLHWRAARASGTHMDCPMKPLLALKIIAFSALSKKAITVFAHEIHAMASHHGHATDAWGGVAAAP
ncbi:MAG: hypothetical protein K2Q97_20045 [Burkholderiaceae bacterium]|nr:hypothetical protein [Burkholderiaceae bacterium]